MRKLRLREPQPGLEPGSSRVADEPYWEDAGRDADCPWLSPLRHIMEFPRGGLQRPVCDPRACAAPTAIEGPASECCCFRDSLRPALSQACLASAPHLLGDVGQGADSVRTSLLPLQNEGALAALGQEITVEYLPGVWSCSDKRI